MRRKARFEKFRLDRRDYAAGFGQRQARRVDGNQYIGQTVFAFIENPRQ